MSDWLKAKIAHKQTETADIVSFKLIGVDGSALPPFTAGAHIDVELKPGLIRQYSLCNVPGEAYYLIAVLKTAQSRGGSVGMHDLAEGTIINISAPRDHFVLVADAKKSLLFAGGIGVTPLLSMAEQLNRGGADFQLHYCARSREHMAFIDRIRSADFANRVLLHFDNGPFAQKLAPEKELATVDQHTQIYVCGPSGFMDWIIHTAHTAGWSQSQIHREYFTAPVIEHIGALDTFEVEVASSKQIVVVEAGQSITNVLRANGVYIPTSCEQGVCGTCLTNVIEGIPDHCDAFLTPDERAANSMMLPCCSRSKSRRLVLDL